MISFTCMAFPFFVYVVVSEVAYVAAEAPPTIAPTGPTGPPSQSRARRCHLRSPRTVTEGAQA